MNLISELEDVLREEQELLLAGNLDALEGLVTRKAKLAQKPMSKKVYIANSPGRLTITRHFWMPRDAAFRRPSSKSARRSVQVSKAPTQRPGSAAPCRGRHPRSRKKYEKY